MEEIRLKKPNIQIGYDGDDFIRNKLTIRVEDDKGVITWYEYDRYTRDINKK